MTQVSQGERVRLRTGHWVLIRPLGREDGPALVTAVERLSTESRYRRFMSGAPGLSEDLVDYLINVDHYDHEALTAVSPETGDIVAVARFVRDRAHPATAEMALGVADGWQRRGLGALMLRRLAGCAAAVGIEDFTAEILAENRPMLTLVRRVGGAETTLDGLTVMARMPLANRLWEKPAAA